MKLNPLIFIISCLLVYSLHAQDIELYNQFSDKVDFTMIGNTLNTEENGLTTSCSILTSSMASLNLDAGDTIVSAYLYWAGSGSGDFEVTLNNQTIIAERTFLLASSELNFFSAFADVTNQVQAIGSGNYTLADLDLTNVIPNYCPQGLNFGGWAIIIVFSNDNLPVNQINIYDGLESISASNTNITIQLDNLNVIDNTAAKIGFLTWEGDTTNSIGESLTINGNILTNPPLNPINNVFNGTNSFTGESDLFNMDLDFYMIENYINIGDTSATIELRSSQDFIMLNSVVTKVNSKLPDAIVVLNSFQPSVCNEREVIIDFDISNVGFNTLNPNTPVSLYIDNVLITTIFTQDTLLPNQSENFNEIISIPNSVPQDFILTIVVDDDGNGNSTVFESNELNNSLPQEINFTELELPNLTLSDITIIDNTTNNTISINTSNLGSGDYEFSIDDEFNNYQDEPIFHNVSTGIHTIYVRDKNNCGVISIEVVVIGFPNFFTPNNDGHNDYWNANGLDTDFYTNSGIYIYNRFGKILAIIDPTLNGWDGLYNGKELPQTDYWFSVELVRSDGSIYERKGHFSLVRRR
ncbi:MAG: T9SS type B sorting domain-containing protein [Flavobacteriaceae bacterium]|nr:T9SS type B sorting domain-containing protein [Flavobacteriaceae bacterium]